MSIAIANNYDLGEVCRTCYHKNAYHVDGHYNEKIIPCEYKYFEGKRFICKCRKFVPTDNLKYLEMLYDKRK